MTNTSSYGLPTQTSAIPPWSMPPEELSVADSHKSRKKKKKNKHKHKHKIRDERERSPGDTARLSEPSSPE